MSVLTGVLATGANPALPSVEAALLESLRYSATDFEECQDGEILKELEQRCLSELNMKEEDLKFLVEGVVNYRRLTKDLHKTSKNWKSRLRQESQRHWWRPRVALILSEGQAIRTFLFTDVCKKLAAWAELFVLSPYAIEAEVVALGPHAHFLPIPTIRRTRFDYLVGYLGYLQTMSPTSLRFAHRLNENYQRAIQSGEPLPTALRIWQLATGYHLPGDYLRLYSWNLKLFAHKHILKVPALLLRTLAPDMIFNTSLVSWPGRLWTRAAALNGTPIVSNVISWDNMSTKTLLDEFVDIFLIWSEEMDEDFSTSVPFIRQKPRVIVGSPQFEPILEGRGLLSRQEFLGRHGLDPDRKLILYTTGSKTLFPREAECLDCLLGHWREKLRGRASIMVRMHPKDRQGRYQEVMAKFPEVPFTVAGQTVEDEDEWVPALEDIGLLVNQLHHCDLIINVASTMTLEGFVIDKPSINIGFSLGLSVSARYPMDDYYTSRHYRDIVESGAARLVRDYNELFAAIDAVLDGHQYDVSAQKEVLWKKCNFITDSSRRIDRFLRRYALWKTSYGFRCLGYICSRVMRVMHRLSMRRRGTTLDTEPANNVR